MKALVVTNCATAAYTSGLQVLFPDWEVKGANLEVAQKWLGEEPKENFRNFLADANLLVVGSENESVFGSMAAGKEVLSIPYFYFRGFHPDSFHVAFGGTAIPSVLGSGSLHSRITVAAFVLGLTTQGAAAAFQLRTYERIGYFSVFETETRSLLQRFGARGIDIARAFETWRARGNFLYTYNHPKAFVFNDILVESLSGRYLGALEVNKAREKLASVPDYLEPSIRWPVYPEIAAKHGIESESDFRWRTGVVAGPISMALDEFVARTFEMLARYPGLSAECIAGFADCRAALVEQLDNESPRALEAAP